MTSTREFLKVHIHPWVLSRHSVVSWLEMEQFAAGAYYHLGMYLGRIKVLTETFDPKLTITTSVLEEGFGHAIEIVKAQCADLGLKVSIDCADDFLEGLKSPIPVSELQRWYVELANTISREMRSTVFFYLPADRVCFYNQSEMFGSKVNNHFPRAHYDIVESGNCYAMGRSTACVFHLMRVMEIGVQVFGDRLGVPLTGEKCWQKILDMTNPAIRSLSAKGRDTVVLSQAAAHLYCVKVGWRNEVMHPNDVYTLEEAKDLLHHVKAFMNTLAELDVSAVP